MCDPTNSLLVWFWSGEAISTDEETSVSVSTNGALDATIHTKKEFTFLYPFGLAMRQKFTSSFTWYFSHLLWPILMEDIALTTNEYNKPNTGNL